jgi:homocysteine S-methyltransferase
LAFSEQISDLWTAGVDAIHLEFYACGKALKAALCAVAAVEDQLGCRIPTIVTLDLDPGGTIMSGERPEELWEDVRAYKPIALGLVTYGYGQDAVRRLREATDGPLGFLVDPYRRPDENQPVDWLAECLGPLLDERLLSFCGLSCTVPAIEYVREAADLIRRLPPSVLT